MMVIPVAHAFDGYAAEVAEELQQAGFYAEANLSSETLKKKILEAQLAQWNYILGKFLFDYELTIVVGQVERDGNSVNVRIRDDVSTRNQGVPVPRDEFVRKVLQLKNERSLEHSLQDTPLANGE